jgi:UDP-N-acetylmuramyl tripeptide synthase
MELGLPGRCNRANAGLAVAAAARLGVPPPVALAAAAALTSVGGRYARVGLPHARTARLLLAKNPGSWSETLEVLDRPPARAVIAVNDGVADGADVSWLWDVPFERLQGRAVTAAGTRALDVAVRLRYADVGHDVVEDPARAVADCDEALVDVVANYTAFHRLCRDLGVG